MFDEEGRLVAGKAMYYGPSVTNNEAEGRACLALLECIEQLGVVRETVVLGDSKLWIEFVSRVATPTKRSLRALLYDVRAVGERLPAKVTFAHIPRAENQLADWLANVAIARKLSVDLFDLYPPLRPKEGTFNAT